MIPVVYGRRPLLGRFAVSGAVLCGLGHHKIVRVSMDVEESAYPVERHCVRPDCVFPPGTHFPRFPVVRD